MIYTGPGHETFLPLELVGYLLVVPGTLIYNEVVVLPWFGLNENTKTKLRERKEKEEEE